MKATKHTPLSHLPLRPSTQQLFATRGFHTQQEVQESFRSGGLANLAAELGIALSEAGRIWHELQSLNDRQNNHNNNNKSTTTNNHNHTDPQQQQQQQENRIPTTIAHRRPLSAQTLLTQRSEGATTTTASSSSIITFCRDIDQMLRGGIPLGELTELAGHPGAGKTQWGMQLAVNAKLAHWAGGVQGDTCYIDTEGSFSPERCFHMAQALIHHVQTGLLRKRRKQPQHPLPERWDITPEHILNGIHVIRVHDNAALQATLEGSLPQLVRERAQAASPIRLVVVDSIAFPIRATPMTTGEPENNNKADFFVARSRLLTLYAQQLAQLAATYHLAAVAINQMTTKLITEHDSGGAWMIPALGESWAHAVTTRLILSHHRSNSAGSSASEKDERRLCTLVKSPRLPPGSAHYQVLSVGIRGVEHAMTGHKRTMEETQTQTTGTG